MLVGFAFQYVDDGDIAEDLVQEVFGNIWKSANDLTIRTNEKSYLFGAVRNACMNHLRHQKVKATYETESSKQLFMNQENFLEMDELQEKVNEVLNNLPEKRRKIFELSRFEDKKYHEIADELNISIKTVETQMSRALKAMRKALDSYLFCLILLLSIFILEVCRGKI